MNKEWYNSLYQFNQNTQKTLPIIYNHTFNLFKWYFNMTNNWIEKKIYSRHYKKMRQFTGNKIWISNPEIKHYNNKINITIYTYNNIYNFYKKKLELFQLNWGPGNIKTPNQKVKTNIINFRLLKREFPLYTGTNKINYNNTNNFYRNIIRWLKLNKSLHISMYKHNILNYIKDNKNKQLPEYLNNLKIQNYNYLINQFNKQLLYLKLRQKILFNEFKYNEISLPNIIKYLQNLYVKKVEVNIVSLKYFWLSTSIFLQILTTKIKSPKNRGKYNIPLDYAMGNIKIPILSRNKFAGETKPYIGIQNAKLNEYKYDQMDYLNGFLINNIKHKIWSDKNIDGLVLSNLENKVIAGVFIKIKGRLTKRYKAQRAIKKLKFKGTLKNVYSAHRNYSSSLSRGYSNINIEKLRMNSNIRIGAFGLTGWIASY